jgi:hypothetical protein
LLSGWINRFDSVTCQPRLNQLRPGRGEQVDIVCPPPAGDQVACMTGPVRRRGRRVQLQGGVSQRSDLLAFSYDDNRYAIDVVGYDSTGAMVASNR